MTGCLLFLLALAAPCALCGAYGGRSDSALPLSLFALVIVQYALGLLGLLRYAAYAALLPAAVCVALVCIRLLRKRVSGRAFAESLFTPAFTAFLLLYIVAVACNVGRAPYHGDEFSHWAYTVKAMTRLNDLATNPAAASLYASYPPGMALLQTCLQKLHALSGGVYTEWLLFVPYQVTAFALLLSALGAGLTWKNALLLPPLLIAALALPAVLYPLFYESLFVDPIVGLLAGYLLSVLWRGKRYDALTRFTLYAGLFTLTLMKDAALFFAVLCGAALLTDLRRAERPVRGRARAGAVLSVALAKASWALHVRARGVPVRFSESAPLSSLPGIVTGADAGFRHTAFKNYLRALFERRVGLGADAFTALGGEMPGWRFYVSFFALAVVLLALLYACSNREGGRYTATCARHNRIVTTAATGLALYWIGLAGLYMLKLVEFEAVALYCYERYFAIPFVMLFTLLLAAFFDANTGRRRPLWAMLVAAALLFFAPLHSIYPYLTRRAARESAEMTAPKRAVAAFVEKTVPPEANIYLLAQGSDGEGLIEKYLLYPRIVTGGAIGAPMYEGDAWAEDVSCAEWQALLKDGYDYVLLSRVDETFTDRCAKAFCEPDTIGDGELYAVDADTGMLTHIAAPACE